MSAKTSGLERAAKAVGKVRPPKLSSVARKMEFPYRAPSTPRTVEPLPKKETTGAGYDTEWARRFPARWARVMLLEAVVRPAIAAVARPERRGLDNLQGLDGPVIFAANHHSHVDAGLMLTSLPEPFRYRVFAVAAADYFFKTRVTGAASALVLNAIPFERAKVTRKSADQAAELIGEGWSMVIFPEGGRSPDGWGQPFRGGAAYLALRCDVPIVPVHLEGTGRILHKGSKKLQPASTIVTFGRPIHAAEGEDSRRLAARLEHEVSALADEVGTDWYTARTRAHAGATPTLAGPTDGAWRRAWSVSERTRRRRRRTTSTAKRWPDLS